METAQQSLEHKLTLDELLQLLLQEGMVESGVAQKLGQNHQSRLLHPLEVISEQKWRNLKPPCKLLSIEYLTEWLAAHIGMPYFHIDPLQLNFGGIANIVSKSYAERLKIMPVKAGRGFMQTVSTKCDWSEIEHNLGKIFEISLNTYKPFACGIVIHPAIDACSQLRAKGVRAEDVERIELRVHPLVLELTGKKTPKDGLEGKFSVYHGCAVGLIFGQAGEGEYADDIVNRADVVALRAKVNATTDTSISEASVDVKAILKNGEEIAIFVKNAIGSVDNPMSDAQLEQKFSNLAEPVIGKEKTRELISALWNLGQAQDLKHILSLCKPA